MRLRSLKKPKSSCRVFRRSPIRRSDRTPDERFPSWQPMMGRLSRFWAHRKRWRNSRLAVVLAIAIAPFSVVVANLVSPHMRVGDGSEYYALYLSWIATARPYLSPALASTYGEMLASKQIIGLHVPFDAFAKAFPHLLVGSTQDVNHFWFYSGLAALIGIVTPFGSLTDPTNAFIALHVLLALAATTIAFYLFRWAGLIAVTLILVASPAIWFANKVHTEYFTITLTSIAVLSLLGRRFTWSVLALALAATQNPSFAVGAVIIGLLWLTDSAQRPTKLDAALVGLASVTAILHPLYYFSRYGGFTPQLFGSGATTDLSSVRHFYIWLLDLDVGLLPNWPLGILLLLLGLHAIPRFRFEGGWRAIVALVTLFVIDLAANSMTVNLNSGATVDVARYGTWYLCFFLPFAITWLRTENESAAASRFRPLQFALVGALATISIFAYRPWLSQRHTKPTSVSLWVQTHAPWLYSPPGEIFYERYGGAEGPQIAAVVGPDCRKIVFTTQLSAAGEVRSKYCNEKFWDRKGLTRILERKRSATDGFWSVVRINEVEAKSAQIRLHPGDRIEPKDMTKFLSRGWSPPEQWGAWTVDRDARLSLPVYTEEFPSGACVELRVVGFAPDKPREVTLSAWGVQPLTLWLDQQPKTLTIEVPPGTLDAVKPLKLRFHILNPISPNSLGLSQDIRSLGLGLISVQIEKMVGGPGADERDKRCGGLLSGIRE